MPAPTLPPLARSNGADNGRHPASARVLPGRTVSVAKDFGAAEYGVPALSSVRRPVRSRRSHFGATADKE